MPIEMKISEISPEATFAVRWPVLRPGKPIETCHFEGDNLSATRHFGLFENEELAGVASVFECKSSLFTEESQMQLRGMAVLENHRGKGFGEALLQHAENYSKSKNASLIWFNARIVAVPFYEKCGYKVTGDTFDIGDIGKHYVMYKRI
jgi:GNAT superfamily N-acetyltransferase